MSEKVIREFRNAHGKRGGDNTLVGGDLVDVASSPYRNHFLMHSLTGNGMETISFRNGLKKKVTYCLLGSVLQLR
jgi:hypothetical protein